LKDQLKNIIETTLAQLITNNSLPALTLPDVQIERTKDKSHGDFSCNVAMLLARSAKMNPRQIAMLLVEALPEMNFITQVDIAGPGFINFTLSVDSIQQVVKTILTEGDFFGHSKVGAGRSVQVEFVSANPTGPLHVGHGRGAAYGSAVSSLLGVVGFDVHREYYVNDAGRQMDILATSVWLRYLEACGQELVFPSNGYKGDYVLNIAQGLKSSYGDDFVASAVDVFDGITADEPAGGDKEQHIDGLIKNSQRLLGEKVYRQIFDAGLKEILSDISQVLSDFGTDYDNWFSERTLIETGVVDEAIEALKKADMLYQKAGAWWFKSTEFGDEKDRVVVRDNGQTTYFASDIAYHMNKYQRGFDTVVDVWGSDHHGYIPRVKASLAAMGEDVGRLKVLLVQFAVLYRGNKKVAMSTRSGQFVTLRELQEEIGRDAARFFYVLRGADQHMDFDLELAKSQSNDNPVYYVQYAHARICSVFRQLAERNLAWNKIEGENELVRLTQDHEQDLFSMLARYPEVINSSAINYTPHLLAHYLMDLARDFHTYYNAHPFIVDDLALSQARLTLVTAVKQVIANGLSILGVSAPETM
jgi:arginyl-tRNA synthetase